jgi:hypothetical protein
VSVLFRGDVDSGEAQALLDANGSADLRLIDNGFVGGLPTDGSRLHSGDPSGLDPELVTAPHSYHLAPESVSKASAAARHRQIRGYEIDETISIGDSAEDVGMAAVTGAFWLVGGPHTEADEAVQAAAAQHPNVRFAEGGPGEAVYEAIVTTLMLGREA